jgi:AraC family L-rhamnose operon transcriptional activator RhaR/AraC family L-rhamnose operon regulatory protein RhaS
MKHFFHLSLNQNPPGCWNAEIPHTHEHHQLLYCTAGETGQRIGEWELAMRAGDVLFIPAGVEHRSLFPPERKSVCFVLDFQNQLFTPALAADKQALEVIEKLAWFQGRVPLSREGSRRVRAILEEFLAEFQRKGPAYEAVLKMMTLRLLIALARDEEFQRHGRPICPAPSHEQMMREVLDYLEVSYMQSITVDSVLEFCPLSRSYFHAVFKQATGKTLVQYLRDIRLKKAKEQLASTDTPIAAIAAQTGLGTPAYFGQLFHAATGLSPRDYRRRHARQR